MAYQPAILGSARLNNFRLNYQSAALKKIRDTRALITLNGVNVRDRVRLYSFSIRDVINDTPNSCAFSIEDPPPNLGDRIEVKINSNAPQLLFAGIVQMLDLTYEAGLPVHWIYQVSAIDDTERLNRIRPYGAWVNTSASIVAETIVNRFAPGFTVKGIQPNLPPVSVNFDTSEGFDGCLKQLAKLIGGYFYVENLDVHLFQEELTEAPDPVDLAHRPLNTPPIANAVDFSQLRTRVYGVGGGSVLLLASGPGDTSLPVEDVSWFEATGGQVIAPGTQRLSYTGLQVGGIGTIVGPGMGPTTGPIPTAAAGAGIESGLHSYAVTFRTASGESLASPANAVTLGPVAVPTVAPVANPPTTGGALGVDTYDYAVTFQFAGGETTPGPYSNAVTTAGALITPPASSGNASLNISTGFGTTNWNVGDVIDFALTWVSATGETTVGPLSNAVVIQSNGAGLACYAHIANVPIPTDPAVTAKRIYTRRNGAWAGGQQLTNATTGLDLFGSYGLGPPPSSNTATGTTSNRIIVSNLPTQAGCTRRLYRRCASLGPRLLADLDATATTFDDTIHNSNLTSRPSPPATNTATANQVALASLPRGPASVTQRSIYRTKAGLTQLQLLATIADNTTTTYTDTAADATLGANAPTVDTSGLTQPDGQIIPGSSALPVASPTAFDAAGGWAIIGNGEQVIRYTGISGINLIGIPATGRGAIVATVTYNSTVTAAPALVGIPATGPGSIQYAILARDPVNIWVQRDDLVAQASYGVHEGPVLRDERRTTASLVSLCDAELALYANPIQTVTYATRDVKTRSGKTVTINFTSPPIAGTLVIQDATITELDLVPGLAPRFSVTASSIRFSLEDVLRRAAGAESTR